MVHHAYYSSSSSSRALQSSASKFQWAQREVDGDEDYEIDCVIGIGSELKLRVFDKLRSWLSKRPLWVYLKKMKNSTLWVYVENANDKS